MPADTLSGLLIYGLAWASFGAAHSLLARDVPKRLLRRKLGRAMRVGWNLLALLQLALVMAVGRMVVPALAWPRPTGVVVFQATLGLCGLALLLASLRSYDMGRFAGVTQLRDAAEPDDEPFSASGPLRHIRHPLYAGTILILLALVGDLRSAATAVFATLYILVGLRFEEAALLRRLGPTYRTYRDRVPALLPWPGRAWPCPSQTQPPADPC